MALRKTRYIPTPAPANAGAVRDWVSGEFERVLNGIESPFTHISLDALAVEPERKPAGALIVFADGTNWDPGSGAGIYAYYNGAWNKLG